MEFILAITGMSMQYKMSDILGLVRTVICRARKQEKRILKDWDKKIPDQVYKANQLSYVYVFWIEDFLVHLIIIPFKVL